MRDQVESAPETAGLQHGDHVDIHSNGTLRFSGYVDDAMPQLGIVWVRELLIGERKMLSTDEYCIVRH